MYVCFFSALLVSLYVCVFQLSDSQKFVRSDSECDDGSVSNDAVCLLLVLNSKIDFFGLDNAE